MSTMSALVWISTKPLLKLMITSSFGYFLTKADLFGAVAARGAGQVLLNVLLPALLFSKIVPGFTTQNIAALGPLVLVACIYQLYGFLIAWAVRKLFWVPRRFRHGILVAGAWNNCGDMPTSVIVSMTASAPFSKGDSDLAVAYISVFILVFFVTLFPLGGHRLVARDYADGAMPVDADDDAPESTLLRLYHRWTNPRGVIDAHRTKKGDTSTKSAETQENLKIIEEKDVEMASPQPQSSLHVPFYPSQLDAYSGGQPAHLPTSTPVSPAPTLVEGIAITSFQKDHPVVSSTSPTIDPHLSRFRRMFIWVRTFVISLANPPTIAMATGFLVALIPSLKALFITPAAGSNVHVGTAPDGLPPLDFVLDTATFIGRGSIPLGLICLGSALARLQIPKPFSRAPIGAITAFTILKMVLGPVFGVLVVEGLTHHTSLINPNDKVLRFVCMYLSTIPTATTQVYLTQIHTPDGSASHISAFLIPQYAFMFITATTLSVYAINILF